MPETPPRPHPKDACTSRGHDQALETPSSSHLQQARSTAYARVHQQAIQVDLERQQPLHRDDGGGVCLPQGRSQSGEATGVGQGRRAGTQ